MTELWVTTALEVLEVANSHCYHDPFALVLESGEEKVFYRLTPAMFIWIERCLANAATRLGPAVHGKEYQALRAVATSLATYVSARYGEEALQAVRLQPVRLAESCDGGVPSWSRITKAGITGVHGNHRGRSSPDGGKPGTAGAHSGKFPFMGNQEEASQVTNRLKTQE